MDVAVLVACASCGDAGGARRAARRDCLCGLEPDVPRTHELHGSAHRRGHRALPDRVCFRCDQHHQIVAVLLLLAMPLQFSRFSRDYFGDYRRRSSNWLDGNIRGALLELMERDQRAARRTSILRSCGPPHGEWTREPLDGDVLDVLSDETGPAGAAERIAGFRCGQSRSTPAGSLVLANIGDPSIDALVIGATEAREHDRRRGRQAVLHDPAAVNYACRPTVSMSLVDRRRRRSRGSRRWDQR